MVYTMPEPAGDQLMAEVMKTITEMLVVPCQESSRMKTETAAGAWHDSEKPLDTNSLAQLVRKALGEQNA